MARLDIPPMDVTYQALVPRAEKRIEGRALKLSFSGAVIATDELPALGTIVELKLPVGSSDSSMRLFAEVKWLEPASPGGCFGALFLLPTTGRMLELMDLQVSREP